MSGVVIRGDGVAALCCAHLLRQAGIRASIERIERHRLPVIMLGSTALGLLHDVFGPLDGFDTLPRLNRRMVVWGPNAEPAAVPHAALVVSEQILLDSITAKLGSPDLDTAHSTRDWTILAAPPLPSGTEERHFGNRRASATAVMIAPSDSSACWAESLKNGWLFLIPNSRTTGYLLAVGASVADLLGDSRMIAKHIEQMGEGAGTFPAHPRLQWPLCGSGWLACGTAAMAFDPLCGDGTAHAIREAILAAAVVQAIVKGEDENPLLLHYQARMTAGMSRHLLLCDQFYQAGREGGWWESELQSMRQGATWCAQQVGKMDRFQYQLEGFALRRVA